MSKKGSSFLRTLRLNAFEAAADLGGGAAGRDPVGPLVTDIREASGSTRAFMLNIAGVTSLAELQAVADGLSVNGKQ